MQRITFGIELNNKPDKTGRTSVMIRLHMKGQRPARVMTSVKIVNAAKCWNPKKIWDKWVLKHPDKDWFNDQIAREYKRVVVQVEKWQDAEPSAILIPSILAERFRVGTSEFYFDWIDKVMEDGKELAFATYLNNLSAVNKFRQWAPSDLLLEAVTPVLVRSYQQHLLKSKTSNGRRLLAATVNKSLARMHVLHERILIKTGTSPKMARILSPWTDIVRLKEAKPRKAKFHEDVIAEVAKLEIVSQSRRMCPETALQIWMLSRVLAGARFSDVMLLRYNQFRLDVEGNPVFLSYEMLKTGNRISIPLFEEAKLLLRSYWNAKANPTDYVLPYMDSSASYAQLFTYENYRTAPFEVRQKLYYRLNYLNKLLNRQLKAVEQAAGLTQKLRIHNARHSFADLARRIMQQDKSLTVYDIQLMMGHSSFKTTEGYYRDVDNEDSTEAMNAIFNRKALP